MSLSSIKTNAIINQEGFVQLKLQAEQGDAESQFTLGICYEEGHLVEKSLANAIKYYLLAANQGIGEAWTFLANIYSQSDEHQKEVEQCYRRAFDYFQQLAENGDSNAQVRVGTFYEEGKGVPKDLEKAVGFYRLAAEQKNALGQHRLARCYEYGLGIEVSMENTRHYYALAAEQHFAFAEYSLGVWLLNHTNDFAKAVSYFQSIVQRNSSVSDDTKADCYYQIGCCYEKGIGLPQSDTDAVKNFKEAALLGNAEACCRLAEAYLQLDLGLRYSDEMAFKYYQQGEKSGDGPSTYFVGYCYENGLGVSRNLELAIHYYSLADQRGYDEGHQDALKCQRMLSKQKKAL